MNIRGYNREAWNREVDGGENEWTQPVSPEVIEKARRGHIAIFLTAQKPVPSSWFPPLRGLDILCLACGGGQQGPVLAAAGANVTVFDNSPRQLDQDRFVAERENLTLRTLEGDAADLSVFEEASFDLVFNPVSTVFMPSVRPVWNEAYRVLRQGGTLLAGVTNPVYYIFDLFKTEEGILEVKHAIPYSDITSLSDEERQVYLDRGLPLEFGHSLTDLLGGQMDAGFQLTDLYEDVMPDSPLSPFHPIFIATRAVKP